ncbi:uncharacterized protein BDV17DRAFT_93092 [Aspergillus undulatus]|uniref:uncharacterized protein n=1 Tax=Aspergillus undulatus TaxID=1810928 RepID=UPI003CCD13EF
MLQWQQIPPQPIEVPNTRIDFNGLKIKIPVKLQPWPARELRRVSINDFGAGGLYAHVIIEDASYHRQTASTQEPIVSNPDSYLFTWSANSERGARKAVQDTAGEIDHIMTSG